ncbi:hypothetical protein HPQ64_08245 [Rhizobiales bacterium]|uniref:hypothetical protein n=1 Tax=Hongsoonwoonella zoysiae TaxID=2821844 RepID=UPI001560BA82|nr:hypothetical protein [Hongsoonwoonella zoysiae]NRG17676.1 hypothetical protein [Hongsoonwoonella zoysiae]
MRDAVKLLMKATAKAGVLVVVVYAYGSPMAGSLRPKALDAPFAGFHHAVDLAVFGGDLGLGDPRTAIVRASDNVKDKLSDSMPK